MATEQEFPLDPECRRGRECRNFWTIVVAPWFEDLPEGERLSLPERWVTASIGTASFIGIYMMFTSETVFSVSDALTSLLLPLICMGVIVGFGFLLAWKRERTGPVRLYLSGVALPSFVFLSMHIATYLGGGP